MDALDGHMVILQADASFTLPKDMFNEDDVEAFTTETYITIGRLHFKDTLLHLHDGGIESTTDVVQGDDGGIIMVKAMCEGSSRYLVDDTQDV